MSFKDLIGWELDRLGKLGGARPREFMESDANYIKMIERAISRRANMEKIMEHKKDYSLLRPFELEAAKRGERFAFVGGDGLEHREFVAGPDSVGTIIIKDDCGVFQESGTYPYVMAPLAWVEGRPVYKGDVLYVLVDNPGFATVNAGSEFRVVSKGDNAGNLYDSEWFINEKHLTWQKPKTKREGWVNIYKDASTCMCRYDTKQQTEHAAPSGIRIDTVRIEWEE